MSQRVLITGATDGIGLLLARRYSSFGYSVIATGRRDLTSSDCAELFGDSDIKYVCADQTDSLVASSRIIDCMTELGWDYCDLVILNAGIGWFGDSLTESSSQIDSQVRVNLLGSVTLSHTLYDFLLRSESGCLALIGSTSRRGHPDFCTYAATKAGLHGFGRSLREEWRDRVRVVTLHPGPTRTTMHDKAGMSDIILRKFFMSPNRVVNGIIRSISSGCVTRSVSYFYVYVLFGGRGIR